MTQSTKKTRRTLTVFIAVLTICGAIGWGFAQRNIRASGLPSSGRGQGYVVGDLHPVKHDFAIDPVQLNPSPEDGYKKQALPFIETYCLDCHTGDDGEGSVDLAKFTTQAEMNSDLETWARVLDQVEQGAMPPEDSTQPRKVEKEAVKNFILKSFESSKPPVSLGRLRRLNRVEYENTIRDLFRLSRDCFNNPARIVQTTDYFQPVTGRMPRHVLAVSYFYNSHRRHSDLPGVSSLPVDPPVEHGFANDQEALSLSPLLMENYLEISTAMLDSPEFAFISGLWKTMFVVDQDLAPADQQSQGHLQIKQFLPRAFRRPVTSAEVTRYQDLFDAEFAERAIYTEAMKSTVSAILVSPKFLFRTEFMPLEEPALGALGIRQAKNFALANRLSYFLWASMPDDELLQAAREGQLLHAEYLERQVARMMNDRKVKSLATDFGMQWLKVQKVASALPDPTRFPAYYKDKKTAPPPGVSMAIEQLLLFETIMVENRSIEEFIKTDFAFLNRQLIDWYYEDPEKVLGYSPPLENFEDFFRIKWSNGHRGGVMSSGATMISTSTTKRTSPVYRGAWILDVIFNSPPPPAPADIPPLEPAEAHSLVKLNVREKLKKHREDPSCATCHDRIDPMGFAFEMFDAVGRWRNKYENGDVVDSSGELNGEPFKGAAVFKNVILRDKSRFVQAFVEHTMKYALGRQLHYSDEPEIRRLTKAVMKQDSRFRILIKQVVLSEMFRRFEVSDSESN